MQGQQPYYTGQTSFVYPPYPNLDEHRPAPYSPVPNKADRFKKTGYKVSIPLNYPHLFKLGCMGIDIIHAYHERIRCCSFFCLSRNV